MTDDPLRIGVLGAARISEQAIGRAAAETGHRLVAVAARDRDRAERFAADHGVERVHDGYDDVLADDDVEVVYDPLPNGLHGGWTLRTLAAGRHALVEKPSVSHADQAREVAEAADAAGLAVVEAFHYLHHPLAQRLLELTDELGPLREVDVSMRMPPPADDDPRWSFDLAGGSLMDVGCYGLHVLRTIASHLGGAPELVAATATGADHDPRVDAHVDVELVLPGGVPARLASGMTHHEQDFSLTLVGERGRVHAPQFVLPQQDDRLVVELDGVERTDHVGTRSTYAYQLDALHALLRHRAPVAPDAHDAVAQAELIDAVYAAAELPPRPVTPIG